MKRKPICFYGILFILLTWSACSSSPGSGIHGDNRIPVILDTDANNELDDQHAIAYLLLNDEVFNTIGITVNATRSGGEIGEHVKEAQRVLSLCNRTEDVPLFAGANKSFSEIRTQLNEEGFDGQEAVDFIIREAMKKRKEKLVLIPVGKLTNIALALEKEPAIAEKVRVVWLGSNYPDPGEYNLDNDIASMNYILETEVPFEIVTVRYGLPSGTSAVTVTQEEVFEKMPGLGPEAEEAVTGRHGGSFTRFGDYSVDLFRHIDFHDEHKSRSLFDMAAVAIVKNASWATATEIPCPAYQDEKWLEQPGNSRKILVWEYFLREEIITDFYKTFE
ncbi:MAG: nucleoside hydrolase [Bacteroidales bacterium]